MNAYRRVAPWQAVRLKPEATELQSRLIREPRRSILTAGVLARQRRPQVGCKSPDSLRRRSYRDQLGLRSTLAPGVLSPTRHPPRETGALLFEAALPASEPWPVWDLMPSTQC